MSECGFIMCGHSNINGIISNLTVIICHYDIKI